MKIKINFCDYSHIVLAILASSIFSMIINETEFYYRVICSINAAYVCYLFGRDVESKERDILERIDDEDLA